jgi:hypothetical protein
MQMVGAKNALFAFFGMATIMTSPSYAVKFLGRQASGKAIDSARQTPMSRVVTLLKDLKAEVEKDGKKEQQTYDKYSCWCEDALGRKAIDISDGKKTIELSTATIEKLKGQIGTHGAEIEDLKKSIEANLAAQREAEDARASENEEYTGEKMEAEQCIGALEAAINVVTGAGTGKKEGLLQTMQEAQLLSVIGGVRGILKRPLVSRIVSPSDMNAIKKFVEQPEDFLSTAHRDGMSAVQIAQNPFGDYAPQSTQIQGILKSMYDAFAADLEKSNAEEAVEQKAFQELMSTKKMELKTLQATLGHHELNKANKEKEEAATQQLRDDTEAQVEADETFFDETKAACQTKARQWSERSRLRFEELQGMNKAIGILSSPEAQATFKNSTTTFFLQLQSSSSMHRHLSRGSSQKVFQLLRTIAKKFHSLRLAKVAVALQTEGHFDKVIASVDQMMDILRKEEQDDIAHRDRCQVSEGKNAADMEDLEHSMDKHNASLKKMDEKKGELLDEAATLDTEIADTKADMEEALAMRNKENTDHVQALKDDMDAIALLDEAIVALNKFYKTNKIPTSLLQQSEEPEYTVDIDKAPDAEWDANYGGRKSETGNIVALLSLIKEDLENEIKVGRSDDAEAQKEYLAQKAAMKESLDKSTATKTATETEIADVTASMEDTEAAMNKDGKDLSGEEELKSSLYTDCSWVATHFEPRRQKRKAEMAGLVDAKSYLAGVEAGDEV